MHITRIETFVLHVPVSGGGIEDGMHTVAHWGAPFVRIHTDVGLIGTGYTGTHAHLGTDRAILTVIDEAYGPMLIGKDPREVLALWDDLQHAGPLQWVGRSGITHLAHSAVDVALWDLKAKAANEPLWRLLGGSAQTRLEAYDTDGGWLDRSDEDLVRETHMRMDEGYKAVKIKVGSPDMMRDVGRIRQVRAALPDDARLMVDANGAWTVDQALAISPYLAEQNVTWLEEPIWYDDLPGHVTLAQKMRTPIALGEQLYTLDAFRDFLAVGAVHFVQADAVRLAGISEWWQVADLAHAYRKPVVPHIGDMMQIHLHLAIAHPACSLLERIPWMQTCFVEPAAVKAGHFVVPQHPGAGTTLRDDAIERFAVRNVGSFGRS